MWGRLLWQSRRFSNGRISKLVCTAATIQHSRHQLVQNMPGFAAILCGQTDGAYAMSSEKDTFEDRLRRIRDSRAEISPPIGAGRGRMPPDEPGSSSMTKWVIGYLVFGLVCAGGVTLVAANISEGPRAMWRDVQPDLQGANVAPAGPGLIDRLASMVFPTDSDLSRNPIGFLPPAPDGWVRVTPDDAALPNAMDAIKARWPQGPVPLEQNSGFKSLAWYLDLHATSGFEQDALAKTGTSAIYLSGEGAFLNLRLEFVPERKPLGERNDPASWIEGLAAIEEKALESGEILERLTLGGIEVTNQTKPNGKSLIMRPIGSDIYASNGIKLAVPLTNRAILRMEGLAAPVLAQTLITSVDRDALSARHD